MKIRKGKPLIDQHDKNGFWGKFGGNFIPETLKKPVEDLTILFEKLRKDKKIYSRKRLLFQKLGRCTYSIYKARKPNRTFGWSTNLEQSCIRS